MSSFPHASGNLGLNLPIDSTGVIGNVYDAQRVSGGSVQIITLGTSDGVFELQGSNVIKQTGLSDWTDLDTDWVTVDTTPATAPGTCILNLNNFGFRFLRIHFTHTSGTGTASLHFCFKGHG